MGASNSKLSFKKSVFRLFEERNIVADDPYWLQFWELPDTTEDIFSLFAASDIRRVRDSSLENMETLILAVTSKLFALITDPDFPNEGRSSSLHVLNCVRVLTRVMPFMFEKEQLRSWQDTFFWTNRRKRVRHSPDEKDAAGDGVLVEERKWKQTDEQFVTIGPLGGELIDNLTDLLFYSGFTLPSTSARADTVSYTIWLFCSSLNANQRETGIGCTVPVGTSRVLEMNKVETLRLILTLCSQPIYTASNQVMSMDNTFLTYLVSGNDKKKTLAVLCSLVNSTLKYNPAGWRVPYNHIVFSDPKQALVTYSFQLLLVLLTYNMPQSSIINLDEDAKNKFKHFYYRLHRAQDFQFISEGLSRILQQPLQAGMNYFPGTKPSPNWQMEAILLFWESFMNNKVFLETQRSHDFVVASLYYALEGRSDASKVGLARICVLVLQSLSADSALSSSLYRPFEGHDTLPAQFRLSSFSGTYIDFVVISLMNLMSSLKEKLTSLMPAIASTVLNLSPHVQGISRAASSKLISQLAAIAQPDYLLASADNHMTLEILLEAINTMVEHQYSRNFHLVYAIVQVHKVFESLRDFSLESANRTSSLPKELARERNLETQRGANRPMTEPVEGTDTSLFAVGDEPSSEEEGSTASGSKAANPNSDSEDTTTANTLSARSEKARGKLPERTVSTGSLPMERLPFEPSPEWLQSWQPNLPLSTPLALIEQLLPVVNASRASNMTSRQILDLIRKSDIADLGASETPKRPFEWTQATFGCGCIYTADIAPWGSNLSVWRGTNVRLFKVHEAARHTPSLLHPQGAVDAVASNIATRIGNLAASS